ncbi:unnamed protein product [Nyctereutes procyonoides]|uniref:(raccoon dog) hypothetical protein n=1 Tax=Nyctereutes procyonoides TaxID=34880 RepID=A0A811XZ43_NYCPR|nr:unnamed protein product [Nyctereutes procyonoides]
MPHPFPLPRGLADPRGPAAPAPAACLGLSFPARGPACASGSWGRAGAGLGPGLQGARPPLPRPSPGPRAGLLGPGPGRLAPSPPGRPGPPLPPRPAAPGGQRGLLPALLTPVRLPPSPDLTAARPRAVSALWSRVLASPLALFLSVPRECPPATFARLARNGALQGRGSSSGKVPRSSAAPPPCALSSVLPGGGGGGARAPPPAPAFPATPTRRPDRGWGCGRGLRGGLQAPEPPRASDSGPPHARPEVEARAGAVWAQRPGGARNRAESASPGLGGGVSGTGGHPQRAPSGPSSLRVSEPGRERFPGPGDFPEPGQERVPRTGGSRNRAGSASPGLGGLGTGPGALPRAWGVSEPGRERFPGPGDFPEPGQERVPRTGGSWNRAGSASPGLGGSRNRAGSASPGLGGLGTGPGAPPGPGGPGTGPGARPRGSAVRSPRRDVKPSGSRLGPRDPGTQPGAPPRASGPRGLGVRPGSLPGARRWGLCGGRSPRDAGVDPTLPPHPEAGRAQRAARGSRAGRPARFHPCPGEDVPLRRWCSQQCP